MAYLIREHKLLYLCTAKTGCSSVLHFLKSAFDGEYAPATHILSKDQQSIVVDYKHSTLKQILDYDIIPIQELDGYRIFTTTRNPYSFLDSWYRYQRKLVSELRRGSDRDTAPAWIKKNEEYILDFAELPFDEFVQNSLGYIFRAYRLENISVAEPFSPHFPLLFGVPAGIRERIAILRIESIDKKLSHLLSENGLTQTVRIPRHNVTDLNTSEFDYRNQYSRKTIEAVETDYGEFMKAFGYAL